MIDSCLSNKTGLKLKKKNKEIENRKSKGRICKSLKNYSPFLSLEIRVLLPNHEQGNM